MWQSWLVVWYIYTSAAGLLCLQRLKWNLVSVCYIALLEPLFLPWTTYHNAYVWLSTCCACWHGWFLGMCYYLHWCPSQENMSKLLCSAVAPDSVTNVQVSIWVLGWSHQRNIKKTSYNSIFTVSNIRHLAKVKIEVCGYETVCERVLWNGPGVSWNGVVEE
jgi:hypothetical protein